MKSFKELKKQLLESGEHAVGGGFGDTFMKTNAISAIKDYGKGIFDLGEEENLNRVNAFLNAFFRREMVEYKPQLGVLKAKLNIIGLDFPYTKETELREGMNVFPLTRFGGTFGKTPTTPFDQFETTNGFENGVNYNLVINVNSGDNGLYRADAKVVREASASGEPTE